MTDILFRTEGNASRSASLVAVVLACLFCIGLVYPAPAQPARTGTLVIEITGLTSDEGQVRIAAFDAEDRWLKTAVFAKILEIEDRTCAWSIEGVPYGEYGLVVFHDKNANGKNDTMFMGIPTEPYGFPNNARRNFGPAKWKTAAFAVSSPMTEIRIEVK